MNISIHLYGTSKGNPHKLSVRDDNSSSVQILVKSKPKPNLITDTKNIMKTGGFILSKTMTKYLFGLIIHRKR